MTRLCVVIPGFGYNTIDAGIARLQPWKYLFQLSLKLNSEYSSVSLVPIDITLSYDIVKYMKIQGIDVINDLALCKHVFIPVAFGFLQRILGSKIKSEGKQIFHGVLTSPLMNLSHLLYNYFIVKITRTSISIGSLLRENVVFKLRGNVLNKVLSEIIVPSRDYEYMLRERLGFYNKIIVYYPEIPCERLFHKNIENNITTITYFGAFSEERGVISLLKSIREISSGYRGRILFQLLIRRTGSKNISRYRSLLEQKDNNVKVIIGDIPWRELREKIFSSDIIVLPYRIIPSTIPLAFLEALLMYRGILVVSTLVPGIGEHVIKYMPRELLIKPNFSIRTLSRTLINLVESKKTRRNIIGNQSRYADELCEKIKNQRLKLSI